MICCRRRCRCPPLSKTGSCGKSAPAGLDEGLMIHALHTVVIDRQGKLVANLEGNEFTADQLGDLIQTVVQRY
jgi:hypothetical protein